MLRRYRGLRGPQGMRNHRSILRRREKPGLNLEVSLFRRGNLAPFLFPLNYPGDWPCYIIDKTRFRPTIDGAGCIHLRTFTLLTRNRNDCPAEA